AYCTVNVTLLATLIEEVSMVQRGHTSSVVPGDLPRVGVTSTAKLLYRLDITRVARRINPRPLLLVHSEDDEVVPSHVSQRIYDSVSEPKSLWLLPGGDHHFAQHDPDTDNLVLQ